MESAGSMDARVWAERTFGEVRLGDERRRRRAVKMASALARDPQASLPHQLQGQADLKASYRLLESAQVSYEALMRPHLAHTSSAMQQRSRGLLIQDMTEVNYSHHPRTTGLSLLSKASEQGYLLQTVLAVEPTHKQVLGIAAQEAFLRQRAPAGETRKQRAHRAHKESEVWQRQVQCIGAVPAGRQYIHVGDRGSDCLAFLRVCREQGGEFVVRVQHDRRVDEHVEDAETPVPAAARRHGKQRASQWEPVQHLMQVARSWAAQGERTLELDGNQKRASREARVCLSWGTVRLWPPEETVEQDARPLVVTVVRTWEAEPPAGEEALEWLLLTSVEVENEEQGWERVAWYQMRWLVEDYHQCLKTGCQLEARQVQTYEGLRTLLGFLAPLAVRLLQLRDASRQDGARLAQEVMPAEVVNVVAYLAHTSVDTLTTRECYRHLARLGGYLGRKGDGEPGWKTLWKGWLYLQTLLEGIHLASHLSLD